MESSGKGSAGVLLSMLLLPGLLLGGLLLSPRRASGQERPMLPRGVESPAMAAVPGVTLDTGEDPGVFLDTDIRALADTAQAAYTAAHYEEAARLYLDLARVNITDGGTIYNLACCYGLLGREWTAARFLVRAWKAGYRDIAHIREDTDFNAVRGGARFAAVVDSLARVAARDDSTSGTEIWIEAPARLRMRVTVPTAYTASRRWPLVVGLHGLGSNPEQFMKLRERSGRDDFIFATLQAPFAMDVGGPALGYGWFLPGDSLTSAGAIELAMGYVAEAVRELKARYSVGNVYALGFSQGAHLAFDLALHRPELFEGVIAFGGWIDPPDSLSLPVAPVHRPEVFIGHGTRDPVIPLAAGQRAGEILQGLGYRVEAASFEGPHRVDGPTLKAAFKSIVR
jgi:phospholipase/carboxylesterase